MIAVLGGSLTAIAWAFAILAGTRASRSLGPWSTSGWVLLVGLGFTLPLVALDGAPAPIEPAVIGWLIVAGVGYVAGMLLNYTALAGGKVPVAAAIVSTEGAIAATISVLTGESLPGPMFVLLAIVAIGIFLAALEPGSGRAAAAHAPIDGPRPEDPGGSDAPTLRLGDRRAIRAPYVLFAVAAALVFGVALFAAGRASGDVPPSWVVAAGRVAGVALVTLPLAVSRRLRLTGAALPFLLIAGAGEVAGVYAFAWGARESIAITAVLASLSAILAGLIASALGDHISRRQWVGVAVVGAGVTAIALTQL